MHNDNPNARQRPVGAGIPDEQHFRENSLASVEMLPLMLESVLDYAFITTDREGHVTSWNAGAERIFGYTRAEITGQPISIILTPEDIERGLAEQEMRIAETEGRVEIDCWYVRKEGTRFYVNGVVTPLRDDAGNVHGFVKVAHDITRRKQAEEKLRQSEERFRLLVEGVTEYAIFMFDLDGFVICWNQGVRRILGYEAEEFLGKHFSCIFTAEDIREGIPEKELKMAVAEGQSKSERWHMCKDGSHFWSSGVITPSHAENGDLRGFSIVLRDETQRRIAEEQIRHNAFHDTLTGLPNRLLFMEHLKQRIAHAKRHENQLFAVLFLDLNRFKVINDSLGHALGDRLLIAAARKLEAALRPEDIVARFGGDEFTILLSDIHDVRDATRVAERIHDELQHPFNLDGHEVFTTASIGITISTPNYSQPEDVLRDADMAMYRAKARQRGRHEVFEPNMRTRTMALLELDTDLRLALERKEFRLHYQPIVSLVDNRIMGFEALVRWQHPERGLIPPAQFIPIAEETRLIIPIDRWVLSEACRQMRQWQDELRTAPPLAISVNLSSKQFSQNDLIEYVNAVLQQTSLDPRSLKLEITESAVIDGAESATVMMNRLRALGVELYIDDFGTGYSSLSYLHHLPVSVLKIDRSFVSRMRRNGENTEIVKTVVTLAHNLGMEVMAEGMETVEQLNQIKNLSCEYGQGYYFSKPVEAEQARALIM